MDRLVRNNRTGGLERPLNAIILYRTVVEEYGQESGLNIEVNELGMHSMRATAATNALSQKADIANLQEWLGRANSPSPACTIDRNAQRTRLRFGPILEWRKICRPEVAVTFRSSA